VGCSVRKQKGQKGLQTKVRKWGEIKVKGYMERKREKSCIGVTG
jgi:hypothetical protein